MLLHAVMSSQYVYLHYHTFSSWLTSLVVALAFVVVLPTVRGHLGNQYSDTYGCRVWTLMDNLDTYGAGAWELMFPVRGRE